MRKHGDACLRRDPLRSQLVAAEAERLRRRPDPDEAGRLDRFREVRALGEESVPRMNGVGACFACGANDFLRVEVGGDRDGATRDPRVERSGVVGGCDGGGLDAEPLARAEDADGDLAAVRHQEPSDCHRRGS